MRTESWSYAEKKAYEEATIRQLRNDVDATKLLIEQKLQPVMEKRTSELKLIEDMAEKLQNDSKQFAYQTRNIKRIEKQCSPYEPNIAQSNKPSVRSQFKNLHSTLKSKIIKLKSKDRSKSKTNLIGFCCSIRLCCGKQQNIEDSSEIEDFGNKDYGIDNDSYSVCNSFDDIENEFAKAKRRISLELQSNHSTEVPCTKSKR